MNNPSSSEIVVVDYDLGNLFSVTQAIERCGARAVITSDPESIRKAERLILPGVGAFAGGMEALTKRGLVEPLRAFAKTGKPFLGICLGMQLLFEIGEEFGEHEGLALLPGKVTQITPSGADGKKRKVPHIGWGKIRPPAQGAGGWAGSVLENISEEAFVYFVHSYAAIASNPSTVLAVCEYEGLDLCAAVQSAAIVGVQFHPEKSGTVGLKILSNFIGGNHDGGRYVTNSAP